MDKRGRSVSVAGELRAWLAYGKEPEISFGMDAEGGYVGLALRRTPTSHVEDALHCWPACVGLRFANPTYELHLRESL